ncbi:MAG: hypothetical protein P4L51_28300 [Puia sp.]|nr:hypothetical protein [Puia sp.]
MSQKTINGKVCIWLQEYGWCEAKPAGEFKVGEFMRWNFGDCSKVVAIHSQTEKNVTFLLEWKTAQGIETGQRKFNKSRLVAIGASADY